MALCSTYQVKHQLHATVLKKEFNLKVEADGDVKQFQLAKKNEALAFFHAGLKKKENILSVLIFRKFRGKG